MFQRPISSISYNTEDFLRYKLEEWLENHIISAYQYICHKGEDGDKDHIHFRIEPNRRIDAMDLQEELVQNIDGEEKPRRCRPFRPSKEEDWFLYAVHDPDYLKQKYGGGEKGEKLPYKDTDVKVPDNYDLEILAIRAHAAMAHSAPALGMRLLEGANAFDLILQGENPHLIHLMNRTIYETNYCQLKQKYNELDKYVSMLQLAIAKSGFEVIQEGEEIRLSASHE